MIVRFGSRASSTLLAGAPAAAAAAAAAEGGSGSPLAAVPWPARRLAPSRTFLAASRPAMPARRVRRPASSSRPRKSLTSLGASTSVRSMIIERNQKQTEPMMTAMTAEASAS